jgi:hypothetical protein
MSKASRTARNVRRVKSDPPGKEDVVVNKAMTAEGVAALRDQITTNEIWPAEVYVTNDGYMALRAGGKRERAAVLGLMAYIDRQQELIEAMLPLAKWAEKMIECGDCGEADGERCCQQGHDSVEEDILG